MWAQIRLRLGLVLRSQRTFPLIVALLLAPAVTVPGGGAVSDDYVLIGILALPVAAWLTIALTSTGHPTLSQTVVTAAGGRWRIGYGSVVIASGFALAAGAVLSVAPYVLGGRGTFADWLSGWLLLTACTSTAAACGLLASRHAGRRPAAAFLIGLASLAIAATAPYIGPVRIALDAESAHPSSVPTLVLTAIYSLLFVPAAAVVAAAPGDVDS